MTELVVRYILALIALKVAAVPFNDEEIALAQIIQGEADIEYMHSPGPGYCVGWVARNRLESGRYGSSYQELRQEFNGTIVTDPRWRYMIMARLVTNSREDPTNGALYVLSQQDMDKLAFDVGEATLVWRASKSRALFFFKEWQGNE